MGKTLQFLCLFIIFFSAAYSWGQTPYCQYAGNMKNSETPYDSVYFGRVLEAYVKAVNNQQIEELKPFLLSENEFNDIIDYTRRNFPQCLATMDTTYKSVTFMTIFNKFIENGVTINKITVNESKSLFSCSNAELKKIYCDINYNKGEINNGSSRIILLTAKNLDGLFKIGIEVCESKLFSNE